MRMLGQPIRTATSVGVALRQVMDEIGQEAEANGLTPEILESILRGEDE
jgi:hypothetical protein